MADLMEYLNTAMPRGFTPQANYSAEGDSLTFFFRDEPSYRERVDDFLTVYRAVVGDELVGCQIKGLPDALKLLGDFGLLLEDGTIRLGMIFVACMAVSPEPEGKRRYQELSAHIRNESIPMHVLRLAQDQSPENMQLNDSE